MTYVSGDFSWFYLVEAICKLTTPGYGRMCAELHIHIKTLYSKTSLSFSRLTTQHYMLLQLIRKHCSNDICMYVYTYICKMYLHIHIHTIYISYTYYIVICSVLFFRGARGPGIVHAKRPWPWLTLWLMTHTNHTGEFLPAAHGVILNPGGVNNVTMAPWHT